MNRCAASKGISSSRSHSARSRSGSRLYGRSDIARLPQIQVLRKLGLYRRTQAALLARRLLDASADTLTPPMDDAQPDPADDD